MSMPKRRTTIFLAILAAVFFVVGAFVLLTYIQVRSVRANPDRAIFLWGAQRYQSSVHELIVETSKKKNSSIKPFTKLYIAMAYADLLKPKIKGFNSSYSACIEITKNELKAEMKILNAFCLWKEGKNNTRKIISEKLNALKSITFSQKEQTVGLASILNELGLVREGFNSNLLQDFHTLSRIDTEKLFVFIKELRKNKIISLKESMNIINELKLLEVELSFYQEALKSKNDEDFWKLIRDYS